MIKAEITHETTQRDLSGEVATAAARVMEDGAAEVVRVAAARVLEKRAGRGGASPLARSIHADAGDDRLAWTIRADAPYARFVEMGTRRMAARPFLLPSVRRVWPAIVARLGRLFEGEAT